MSGNAGPVIKTIGIKINNIENIIISNEIDLSENNELKGKKKLFNIINNLYIIQSI
jgi:hypothetical protein